MELLQRIAGPVNTNVWVLGDEASREALCIDAATPSVDWISTSLAERGWTLKLVVSSHRHWDHIGDNAAVVERTGATLAAHALDRHGLEHPSFTISPPFPLTRCSRAAGGAPTCPAARWTRWSSPSAGSRPLTPT